MDASTQQFWIISLVAAVAVVIVVAIVLELIVRTARQINELVHQIWTGGTRIAQNTVTLALLRDTNDLAGRILGSASEIAKAVSRIRQQTSRAS
jgi:predicted PurR-regulated permease PerM